MPEPAPTCRPRCPEVLPDHWVDEPDAELPCMRDAGHDGMHMRLDALGAVWRW
jgi:hypothetical protein